MSVLTNSVRKKMFISIMICALLFLGVFSLLYIFLYDDYVIFETKSSLVMTYHNIEYAYDDNAALLSYLNNLQANTTIRATIIENGIVTYEDRPMMGGSFYFGYNDKLTYAFVYSLLLNEIKLNEQNPFQIFFTDRMTDGRLVLAGYLAEQSYVILNIPMPIINANYNITKAFILLAGVLAFLFSLITAFFMSRRFCRPLVEIRNIAGKMAQLDFSDRYNGDEIDEIGELGESINSLSGQLEDTISRLQATNDRLEQEIAKERRIDEMRKDFIINVSHELKTPLAIISGYAEGLKVNISDKQEDKDFYCSVILEESERMNKLVGQLLALAKIEAGNVLPEFEVFNFKELLSGVTSKIAILTTNKKINLQTKVDNCEVNADLDMCEQVLMNLLSNAVHHTKESGIITVTSQVRPDNKLRVFVYNSGEQIPEEEQEKIWTSFYKVDKARTRAYGGTGIGLSVVKVIMEAHGNSYGVTNKPNGVEFYFDLDLKGESY